ncbi:MAG: Spy/CpxP family protein refolding chaperone [Elusimicrobiota bacterium]|nr:Spy/CpxP family protein refolding chaperone [Elusimicrobiota bacterium]
MNIMLGFLLAAAVPSALAAVPDPVLEFPLERGVEPGRQWKDKLGLSEEQSRRFTALENERAARLKPLRELLRSEMVKLQAQVSDNASEREVEETLEQVLQIHRAIAESTEHFDAGFAAFLSPSQRARLLVWKSLGGLNGYAARRLETAALRDEEYERD